MSAPLAPGKVEKLREEFGHRWIAHVRSEDCDAVYVWGDPELGGRGVVCATFLFPGSPGAELQRVCRVAGTHPEAWDAELTAGLAAMVEKLGPMPADVWGHLHGAWLKTPDGFAVFEGNVNPKDQERVLITDWCHFSTLSGQTSLEWTMSEVGALIDPNALG